LTSGATIEVAAGKTLNFTGFIADGGFDGPTSVIKDGTGTLVFSGINTNTGNTTINAGTLALAQSAATLATNSTVTIASGAVLQLDVATVTNVVAGLVTNGVAAGDGLYSSANSSGFITGSGYLKVVAPVVGPGGPAPINASYSGGVLTLTWPSGVNWRLESQTNNLSTGLSPTGWGTVSGVSDGSANITVDPAAPSVFYRLVYP
jgi:autotransporter-associated beta strand protein